MEVPYPVAILVVSKTDDKGNTIVRAVVIDASKEIRLEPGWKIESVLPYGASVKD